VAGRQWTPGGREEACAGKWWGGRGRCMCSGGCGRCAGVCSAVCRKKMQKCVCQTSRYAYYNGWWCAEGRVARLKVHVRPPSSSSSPAQPGREFATAQLSSGQRQVERAAGVSHRQRAACHASTGEACLPVMPAVAPPAFECLGEGDRHGIQLFLFLYTQPSMPSPGGAASSPASAAFVARR